MRIIRSETTYHNDKTLDILKRTKNLDTFIHDLKKHVLNELLLTRILILILSRTLIFQKSFVFFASMKAL